VWREWPGPGATPVELAVVQGQCVQVAPPPVDHPDRTGGQGARPRRTAAAAPKPRPGVLIVGRRLFPAVVLTLQNALGSEKGATPPEVELACQTDGFYFWGQEE